MNSGPTGSVIVSRRVASVGAATFGSGGRGAARIQSSDAQKFRLVAIAGLGSILLQGRSSSARLLENWIDKAERRTWLPLETNRAGEAR
jgi:hypothetical protein